MDARLFHGAFPAGDPHALRAAAPGSVRAHSHWAGTETATVSHGAIDGAVRSG